MNNVKMDDFVNVLARALETVVPQNNNESLRPAKFQGHPHEDIENWYDKFIRYADHAQFDANRRLSCLKALLDGPAAAWLKERFGGRCAK